MNSSLILKQGHFIRCCKPFSFLPDENKRAIKVKEGDIFWVTGALLVNPDIIPIARKGKGYGYSYNFTRGTINEYFENIAE